MGNPEKDDGSVKRQLPSLTAKIFDSLRSLVPDAFLVGIFSVSNHDC
jgi:hypothetical protein